MSSTQLLPYIPFSADVTDSATLFMSEGAYVASPATVFMHLEA